MRRVKRYLSAISLTLVVSAVLSLCSLATFASHTAAAESGKSCNSSCNPHSQHDGINSAQQNEEEDKKEPTPPGFILFTPTVKLSSLYLVPVLALVIFSLLMRKQLLSTQLRY